VINSISANPATVILPQNFSKLSATTSDPQGQLMRHWWVVKSAPAGAKPVFDHQGLANSDVSGLTLPGSYTFTLRAFDDLHMTTKDVTVIVNKASGGVTNISANDEGVDIYPNPVSDELNVRIGGRSDKLLQISLSNSLGSLVRSETLENGGQDKLNITLRYLPSGVYFLTLQTKNRIIRRKIIKE
jgi:hypothetical protein